MKFVLAIDADDISGDPTEEVSRALRYWAGNLTHYDLTPGMEETIYDSEYKIIGEWRIS